MSYTYRCPNCGALPVGALASSPDVPVYGCGSYGRTIRCQIAVPDQGNLTTLTRDESRDLLDLFDFASLTIIRSVG